MKRDYSQLSRSSHTFKWIEHPLYHTWNNMKARCYDKNSTNYNNWGGRGIKVCKKWKYDFEQFVLDMGDKPSSEYSLDRIDNNKNYKPSNCRWATRTEQNRNKRTYVNNNTGYSGIIELDSGGFQVRTQHTKVILGVFKTLEKAIKAQNLNKKQTDPRLNNTSGVRGVSFDKKSKLWNVRKVINGVRIYLGSTKTLEDAENLYKLGVKQVRNTNNTGVAGICKLKNNTFRVRVTKNKKRLNLGCYKSLKEAKEALYANS